MKRPTSIFLFRIIMHIVSDSHAETAVMLANLLVGTAPAI